MHTIRDQIDELDQQMAEMKRRAEDIAHRIEGAAKARDESGLTALAPQVDEIVQNMDKMRAKRADLALKAAEEVKLTLSRKDTRKMNLKQAIGLVLAKSVRRETISDEERKQIEEAVKERAVGDATTTTSDNYVEPTNEAVGINNGGMFIPAQKVFDVLNEELNQRIETPMFDAIRKTAIKGLVKFPYRLTRTTAKLRDETKAGDRESVRFGEKGGSTGYLQSIIRYTDEVANMSAIDFGDYLIRMLASDFAEDSADSLTHRAGVSADSGSITGYETIFDSGDTAAFDGGAGTYADGAELATLETILSSMTKDQRRGGAIYIAHDLAVKLRLQKDKNGSYLNPGAVFGGSALDQFVDVPLLTDDTLNPGEIVAGNIAKGFRLNFLQPIQFETQRYAAEHMTDLIISWQIATAVIPGYLIKASKAVAVNK